MLVQTRSFHRAFPLKIAHSLLCFIEDPPGSPRSTFRLMQEQNKTVLFINENFFFAVLSIPEHLNLEALKTLLKEDEEAETVEKKFSIKKGVFGKKKEQALVFSYVGNFKEKKVQEFLQGHKFVILK